MKRALPALLLLGLAGCPGGLNVDYGNAFPCDFSADEAVRDAPCTSVHPGEWVCGTDNVCRPNADEGLQGETPEPTVLPATRVLPQVLAGPNRLVASDPQSAGRLLVLQEDGGFVLVTSARRQFTPLPLQIPSVPLPRELALGVEADGGTLLALRQGDRAAIADAADTTALLVRDGRTGDPVAGVRALRMDARPRPVSGDEAPVSLVLDDGTAGETRRPTAAATLLAYRPLDGGIAPALPDGGPNFIADVRFLPRNLLETVPAGAPNEPLAPVALTRTGFFYREERPADGGVVDRWIALHGADEPLHLPAGGARLRHSATGTLWAAVGSVQGAPVLTTWALDRGNPPRMVRAWEDCVPCRGDAVFFTPSVFGGTSVEVLCEGGGQPRELRRITGVSATVDQRAGLFECEAETLEPPIDLSELFLQPALEAAALDDTVGDWVTAGGRHGQVWTGPTLSTLQPLSLDRVPTAVGVFGGEAIALTDRYLAVPLSQNGTLAVSVAELLGGRGGISRQPAALVGGLERYLLLSTAELVHLEDRTDAGISAVPLALRFGPRLESAAGGAAAGPFNAEGMTAPSGELRIVATAGDSIYQHVVGTFTELPGALPAELPQLTPEPGFPIRSLTLDRATPLRSASDVRVRGYVVTSRNVFDFQLGGAPERWTLRQVPLPAGEPVEVWMEAVRSPLGRVGYRDGTVFTLPGGYPMVQRLPEAEDGGVPRVLDFTNLNGYPVALTERGVFLSRKNEQAFPDGGTSRILVWERLPLPVELEERPDRFQRGRIESLVQDAGVDPASGAARTVNVLYLFTAHGHVYRLASSSDR